MGMGEEHAAGGAVATGAPEDGLLPDERAAASASEGSAQVRGGAAGAPEGGAVTEKTPSTGRDMEAVLLNVKTP